MDKPVDSSLVTLRFPASRPLSDDELLALSSLNRDLRFERNAQGDLIVMPPAGGNSSERNAEITMQLMLWRKRTGKGEVFDSSGGFTLRNGALRSPDASWVSAARLERVKPEQQEKFLPLCPEFVIELRSPSDSLRVLQEKMQEYLDNGAELGWLLDPEKKRVYIYRPGAEVEVLEHPESLPGEPLLEDFTLDLRDIW
jgi:Uma2 family endonuclease